MRRTPAPASPRCFRPFLALWAAVLAGPIAAVEPAGPVAGNSPSAVDDPRRFVDIFAPFVTETASLSPDGKHLAYSIMEQGLLYVVVVAIDAPKEFRAKVAVNSVKGAQPDFYRGGSQFQEDLPARISWMNWTSATRLVVLTQVRSGPALIAFDADGANARVLATSRTRATLNGYAFFGRSPEPDSVLIRQRLPMLPSLALKPQIFYDYQRLNTVTGKFTTIDEEVALDEQRQAKLAEKARRGDWQAVDREVREVVPDRQVSMIENDDAEVRFLALVEGRADPGSFCVIDRERRVMFDLARRLPDFAPAHATIEPFEFTVSDGQKVSGELMLPREPKVAHVPVVVFMPDKPGQKMARGFSREAQAFARMGLASVRFDSFVPRLQPGEPERIRERWLVDEVVRLVDGLPALHRVSKRSIVLFGERQGGYLALRALQIQPERFIAAVAVMPTLSRERWDDPVRWPENAGKPGGPPGIKRAVQILSPPPVTASQSGVLRSLLRDIGRAGVPAEWTELSRDFQAQLPLARSKGFHDIERFINSNVYQFIVKLGEFEVKP